MEKETRTIEFGFDEMKLNMGPQHPSTHGVLRLQLVLEGEEVKRAIPHIGYLHRGVEKLAETLAYVQNIPIMSRNDYIAPIYNEFALAVTIERLGNIEVPKKAEYLRVIMGEFTRIASHLVWIGTYGLDLGGALGGGSTLFLYAFREREKIMDLFEEFTGARFHPHFIQVGGVRYEPFSDFDSRVKALVKDLRDKIQEIKEMVEGNKVFLERTRNVGIIPEPLAKEVGVSGPVLRGSGVKYDVRKNDPYSAYPEFEFDIPVGDYGDAFSRYAVRMEEMFQSLRIIEQAIEGLPEGPISSRMPVKVQAAVKLPKGEVYGHVESPRGELGYYIVSDGTQKPYRLKIRAPSFSNLAVLPHILPGHKVADVVSILGSLDPVFGDVDR